jgi:hypothetical protein
MPFGCARKDEGEGARSLARPSLISPSEKAMVSVIAFAVSVESLVENPSLLPSVDELRPRVCPGCGAAAFASDKPYQIVGHGTFMRQVLGLVEAAREALIQVRRYRCRGCRGTICVLPDELYPQRWYAGTAILVGLFLHLVRGVKAGEVRARLNAAGETSGWKTLRRWRRDLLSPLWGWFQQQLGFIGPAATRAQGATRLRRLLAQRDVGDVADEHVVAHAAQELSRNSVHVGRSGRLIGHDPSENLNAQLSAGAASSASTEEDRRTPEAPS